MTSSSISVQSSPVARFLNISHLAPDETLIGYLLRLAQDNGYAGNKQLCTALGLAIEPIEGDWPSSCCPQFDLSLLAQATGYEETRFQQIRYHGNEQSVTFGNIRFPSKYIKFKYPKFCSACLAESLHHRWYWDLAHVTVCVKHKLLLIDRCPACRKRIYWDRALLAKCACGCDWTEITAQPICEPDELSVSQRVMLFGEERQQRSEYLTSFLGGFGLDEFLDVTFFVAELYLLATKGWTLKLKKQNHIFHLGLTNAISLLTNPPGNLFAFLDKLARNESQRILPMCRDYLRYSDGPLAAWVSEYVEGYPDRRQLRMAFLDG